MNDELATIKNNLRLVKVYALLITVLFMFICLTGFAQSQKQDFDEITAKRIKMVDSTGKTRVILAGEFPKPRADYAGLIFNKTDGYEAGGLLYGGTRDKDGKVSEGSILTFDQYRADQVVALEFDHSGDRKRQGLAINVER